MYGDLKHVVGTTLSTSGVEPVSQISTPAEIPFP